MRWRQIAARMPPSADRPGVRYGHAAVSFSGSDLVVVHGGYKNAPAPHWYADTWLLDTADETWRWLQDDTADGAAPPARYSHTLVTDDAVMENGVHTALLFGGDDGGARRSAAQGHRRRRHPFQWGEFFNDLWVLDVVVTETVPVGRWRQVPQDIGLNGIADSTWPAARASHGACAFRRTRVPERRGVVVHHIAVFGGLVVSPDVDAAQLAMLGADGLSNVDELWLGSVAVDSDAAGIHATMTTKTTTQSVSWTRVVKPPADQTVWPEPRHGHATACIGTADHDGSTGGTTAASARRQVMYVYGGTTAKLRAVSGDIGRTRHMHSVILDGGLWRWDAGSGWRELARPAAGMHGTASFSGPGPLSYAAAAAVPAANSNTVSVVVFGGASNCATRCVLESAAWVWTCPSPDSDCTPTLVTTSPPGRGPSARYRHSTVALGRGKGVLVFGGEQYGGAAADKYHHDAWVLQFDNDAERDARGVGRRFVTRLRGDTAGAAAGRPSATVFEWERVFLVVFLVALIGSGMLRRRPRRGPPKAM